MSENLDLAQEGLDAFNRRDKAAWLALMDPSGLAGVWADPG
jgi:ketosteroid isomerase-like protein